jgi:dTDP-4-amino-4,6-dideoxygalactose transaminase
MSSDMTAVAPVPPTRIDFSAEDRAWIAERITEVLATGRLTLGAYGEEFERQFAAMHGAKYAVAVNSGTASLEIMLRVAGVAGKDVLVPANTFFATASAVIAAGGNPVLMDTDPATLSTTAAEVERRITPKTVGVMIVHIAGFVTDAMPAIAEVAKRKGLWLMEDAAHAHAATLNGKHAGTHMAEDARIYRDQGKASFLTNSHIRMGYNWRMSEPHAVIGLRHLHNLPAMVAARRRIAAHYDAALGKSNAGVRPLPAPPGCAANYYKYVVMLPEGTDRTALKAWLKAEHGVQCSGEVYEFPLHKHPVLAHLDPGNLVGAETACGRQMCLPIFASMTDAEADRVIAALAAAESTIGSG